MVGSPTEAKSGAAGLSRADLGQAGLLALLAFAVYARTACPTIFAGDSAELAAAAATFGVPHPPGYPVYTIVTAGLIRLLPGLEPAYVANLASGVYAAGALALMFLLFRRLGTGRAAAWTGALALAFGATLWSQSVVAEVYTLDLFLLAVVWNAALPAARMGGRARALLFGIAVGLWLGHRSVNLVYLPALVVLAWATGGGARLLAHAPAALAGLLVSALPYLYLPLASAANPPIDIGSPDTWDRFLVVVSGTPYLRHLEGTTTALAVGRLVRFFTSLPSELGPACLLAPIGAIALVRAGGGRRQLAWALLLAAFSGLAFSARYNILDINVYFLPPFVAFATLGALGAQRLLDALGAQRLLDAARRTGARPAAIAGVLLVASALTGLVWNRETCDQSRNRYTRQAAEDLLASVAEDALLLVNGDTTIHALWYLQAVEGQAPGVIVVSLGHLVPWHLEQLAARYPDEDWPPYDARAGQPGHARRLLDRLIDAHPTYVSNSVDTAELFRADANGRGYGGVPRGTALEVRRRGDSYDARERALWNASFFDGVMERLGEIEPNVDMDTKSIFLQYALAMTRTAESLVRLGRPDVATRMLGYVLRFDPDRHERDLHADVERGLGLAIPDLRLGERAQRAIERF